MIYSVDPIDMINRVKFYHKCLEVKIHVLKTYN